MSLASGVGLISGINFDDIITKLISVNSRPVSLLTNQQTILQNRQKALQGINGLLVKLQESLGEINEVKDFTRRVVQSSDESLADVSVSDEAAEGSFALRVLQLAREHRVASQGVATLDQTPIAAGPGSFTYQVGDGTVKNISITATTTLAQLRDAINSDSTAGVRASIVNDGTRTNPFRLVLTSTKSGQANNIKVLTNGTTLNFATKSIEAAAAAPTNAFNGTVTSSGTYTGTGAKNFVIRVTTAGAVGAARFQVSSDGGLTFGAADAFTANGSAQDISGGLGVNVAFGAGTANFAAGDTFTIDAFDPVLSTAQDAIVEIDGVQVRRASNTISDAIDGVTISAKKVSADASAVSIRNDNQNVTGLITAFAQSYNALLDGINKVASFNPETNERGPLFGDSGVRSIRSSLSNILTTQIAGLAGDSSIGAIGIKVESGGKLTVDSAKLAAAVEDNFEGVKKILSIIGSSTSSGIAFKSMTEKTIAGTYAVNITAVAARAGTLSAQAVAGPGITNAETLTFTQNGKTASVVLNAASTLDSVVSRLNQFFADQAFTLSASNDAGRLSLQTLEYGAKESFSVVSDQAGGVATQLGIGTTQLNLVGVDVAGTIDGVAGIGSGQELSGPIGSRSEGLKLNVTAQSPVTGAVTVSRGIADRLLFNLNDITDSTDGLIKTKNDSFSSRIKQIDERIETLNARLSRQAESLRRQFTGLETKLAGLQSQGNFLISQLNQLAASR